MPVARHIRLWFCSSLLLLSLMVAFSQKAQAQAMATARTEATVISSADMTDLSVSPDQGEGFILQNGKNLCFDVQVERQGVKDDVAKRDHPAEPWISLCQRSTSGNLVTRTNLVVSCSKSEKDNHPAEAVAYSISVNFN